MKNLIGILLCCSLAAAGQAQPPQYKSGTSASFIDFQKTFPRPSEALLNKADTLKKQFEAKKLVWPAKYIYVRSFKYDSQLEVWVKNDLKDKFQLFKTYRVCALAGTLGPKRMEGDYQVPEGFYNINEFNPKSTYHLSLGINYPNASDRILSDSLRPGSGIFIHGSCVTIGCIPLRDDIDELYIMAAYAKDQGQDFIPVHIFPVRFNKDKSVKYLDNISKDDAVLKDFFNRLEDAFDYFEKYKQLPVVMISDKGQYIVNEVPPKKLTLPTVKMKRLPMAHKTRNVGTLANSVHTMPQFPGGGEAFAKYLETLGKDMSRYLPEGVKKAYVQLEFVVDSDGVPVNFKVLKSIAEGDELNDEVIIRLEKMGTWLPATLHDKPVAKKMVLTVTVELPNEILP